jgi:hypothetical protein
VIRSDARADLLQSGWSALNGTATSLAVNDEINGSGKIKASLRSYLQFDMSGLPLESGSSGIAK